MTEYLLQIAKNTSFSKKQVENLILELKAHFCYLIYNVQKDVSLKYHFVEIRILKEYNEGVKGWIKNHLNKCNIEYSLYKMIHEKIL